MTNTETETDVSHVMNGNGTRVGYGYARYNPHNTCKRPPHKAIMRSTIIDYISLAQGSCKKPK